MNERSMVTKHNDVEVITFTNERGQHVTEVSVDSALMETYIHPNITESLRRAHLKVVGKWLPKEE